MSKQMIPVTDGSRYIPYDMRSGNESSVYFTRDLSAEGLIKVYDKVSACLSGKIGIKLHTGEPKGEHYSAPLGEGADSDSPAGGGDSGDQHVL